MNEPTPAPQSENEHERGPFPPGWVKLANYGTANEAEIASAVLAAQGIEAQVFGANTSAVYWFWQVITDVDLLVPEADAERAREILSRVTSNDLEPADEPANASPADERGRVLVPVGAYDNLPALRDAQTVLASEQINAYGPRLVLRGDKPPGTGKRFVLRVAEQDLESARALLAEEAEEDRDEPRCPKCGSWRVISTKTLLEGLAGAVGLGGPGAYECLSCHHRGPAAEFVDRVPNS
jgi:hypothetical protein